MALWLFFSILLAQGAIPRADTGVITGVVRLPDGKPAAGVRVAAMVPPDASLRPGNASELASIGKTDESGRYRLEDVPAGQYYIVAGRVDTPTYYPGVTTMSGARALAVGGGVALANIDFVISPESARAPDPFTDRIQQLLLSINLGGGPPVLASGRVVMDAGSPDKKLPAWVTLNARNQENPNVAANGTMVITSGSYAIKSSVAPDGSFSISLRSGDATITVQALPEGYSVKSINSGARDLRTRPLKVEAGMSEIVIVLTADLRPRFTVEGRVLSASNRSMIGEQIELHSDSGLVARIILDAQGQFVFRKLLPGNYTLRLASSGEDAQQRVAVTDHDAIAVEFNAP